MSRIRLHIETLSLPGSTAAERRAFVAALEQELARKLVSGMPDASLAHEVVRVRSPQAGPRSAARSVADGVSYSGSGKGVVK